MGDELTAVVGIPLVSCTSVASRVEAKNTRFAKEESLEEIRRVLKPGGKLAMIWNIEDCTPPRFTVTIPRLNRKHRQQTSIMESGISVGARSPRAYYRRCHGLSAALP